MINSEKPQICFKYNYIIGDLINIKHSQRLNINKQKFVVNKFYQIPITIYIATHEKRKKKTKKKNKNKIFSCL